ncbi:MAG: AAA family ATPase [SAR324 cluster bacterium]|nr:AAA family ATPase [SAR324 cluster bacterium]
MFVHPDYEIHELINESSHSEVFRAVRKQDSLSVILKRLKGEHPSVDAVARFKNGYDMLAKNQMEGVIQVLGLEPVNNTWMIVFEDFGGISLADLLNRPRQELSSLLNIGARIAETLDRLHRRRLIHKDIQPSNILWKSVTGEIRLIDFGLASQLSREVASMLNPNQLEGSLVYISPEQTGRVNQSIDHRTDLYSLGMVLYHLATGRVPFLTSDPLELVHCHLAQVPPPPQQLNHNIPEVLSAIILKLLEKSPDRRYQTASGLLSDLNQCLESLEQHGILVSFEPGIHDLSEQLRQTQPFYGREREEATLSDALTRVVQGAFETILLEGPPGLGKTSLLDTLERHSMEQHCLSVRIKFDSLRHHIPYAGILNGFQELIRQLNSQNEDSVIRWKQRINKALRPNAQLLMDVIPELATLLGPQPDVPEMPARESANRFMWVMLNFIQTFCRKENPLVLFLDDAHYADGASLRLILQLVRNPLLQHLLVVLTYCQPEPSEDSVFAQFSEKISAREGAITRLVLPLLDKEQTGKMIRDMLSSTSQNIQPLTDICYQKTGGNPFFLKQFLQNLHEEKIIFFDQKLKHWSWDPELLRRHPVTENIMEFLLQKVHKLPESSRRILQRISCIGDHFDFGLLEVISHEPPETLRAVLKEMTQEELLLPVVHAFKELGESRSWEGFRGDSVSSVSFHAEYQFTHPRIREMVYAMLTDSVRKQIHLEIGWWLLENMNLKEPGDELFDVVNHLNLGRALISDSAQKLRLAELNWQSGQKMKFAASLQPQNNYFQIGLEMLEPGCWETHYSLTLGLYEETAEIATSNHDFSREEWLTDQIIDHAQNLLDEVRAYEIRIQSYVSQNKMKEAITSALLILARLEIKLPEHPKKIHVVNAFMKTKRILAGKKTGELLNLPETTDPHKLAAARIGSKLAFAAFVAAPELLPLLVFDRVCSSIIYGNTPLSAYGYAAYGMILCGPLGEINAGYEFGQLALNLLDQFPSAEIRPSILFIVNTCIVPWKQHVRDTMAPLLEAWQLGIETGNFEYAALAAMSYCVHAYLAGKELNTLEQEMKRYADSLRQIRQDTILQFHQIGMQAVSNLLTNHTTPWVLTGDHFHEEAMISYYEKIHNHVALSIVYINKLVLAYMFGHHAEALEWCKQTKKYLDSGVSIHTIPIFYMIDSLIKLAVYADGLSNSATPRMHLLHYVPSNQRKLKKWADQAPQNFMHRYLLVEAERAAVAGKNKKAMELYDEAIETATTHQYLQDAAVANERAARFYLKNGNEKIARIYLQEARYGFEKWGASAKVTHLRNTYPDLLTLGRAAPQSAEENQSMESLDLVSVMKVTQVLSGEINLHVLLQKMMAIMIENAGAQQGALLLNMDGEWQIVSRGVLEQNQVHVSQMQTRYDHQSSQNPFPSTVVDHVIQTRTPVVLDHATNHGSFTDHEYVLANKVQSVLCLPLLYQGSLTGVLYLENNLVAGVFHENRLKMLRWISAQIAISLENARLYKTVQDSLSHQMRLTQAYSRFVPDEFLNVLGKESIVEVELGDQVEKEMSILFSDIRDFTSLSERMTPRENFDFINLFLGQMEPVIREHSGFIDKYIGDAIMALFPTNADDAVRGANSMLRKLVLLNHLRNRTGQPPIRIGIGLNTGRLMLGTVGGKKRMDGTVISDAVNLAARLENLTKTYGASLLISEYTFSRLKNPSLYMVRIIDKVRVKGKNIAVSVFDVFDAALPEVQDRKQATLKRFETAISHFYLREFKEARELFLSCHAEDNKDKATSIYLERCDQCLKHGELVFNNGIFEFQTK